MARCAGILMSITSLPSQYGIGTMGKEAYKFADFLSTAGQKIWQLLPLGPTSYGDSPYQSFSIFAGNPYLIDLDMLIADGLLCENDVKDRDWGSDREKVDYEKSTTPVSMFSTPPLTSLSRQGTLTSLTNL